MTPEIKYLPDASVDDVLDKELRVLLTTCFTKPQAACFKERRYRHEPPAYRWIIRNQQGALVAHTGVHDKEIEADGKTFRTGGICEVCVHPDHRGKGYVRALLDCAHEWLSNHGYIFAGLFGNPAVYGSSGYATVSNFFNGGDEQGWKQAHIMIRNLSNTPWPDCKVYMRGPGF